MTRSVYLDTNVFIAAFETSGSQSDAAWAILDAVTDGRIKACTSELTLAELLPKPMALRSEVIVELYTELLKSSDTLAVIEVSRAIVLASARIRAKQPAIKLPDAIHIATALQAHCAVLVSDDRRMRGFTAIHVVDLSRDSLNLIMDAFS